MRIQSIIGIDCATQPRKVGLARGNWDGRRCRIVETKTCSPHDLPEDQVAAWLRDDRNSLLALDAPLGWPLAMSSALRSHRAGQALNEPAAHMFSRATDRFVHERIKQRPLEVGASWIARTAHAALSFLGRVRETSDNEIPLAWSSELVAVPAAIEVYPAATLRAYGWRGRSYNALKGEDGRSEVLRLLTPRLDLSNGMSFDAMSGDELDAAICASAGADFLTGDAIRPDDVIVAKREGWIWVRCPS